MKMLTKRIFNISVILFAIIIILALLWAKLIRIRLPRDIPFELTEIQCVFLVSSCFIYISLIINLLVKKKSNSFFSQIVDFIFYKPLRILDSKIKTHLKLKELLETLSLKVITLLSNSNYFRIYFCFQLVPKIIILLSLIIDTFLVHKLNYFYKSLALTLVIYILFYFKYSLSYILDDQSRVVDESIDINYCEPPYNGRLIPAKQYAHEKALLSLQGSTKEPSCVITMNIAYMENRFKTLGLSFKTHRFNSKKIIEQRKSVLNLLEDVTLILYQYDTIKNKYETKFSIVLFGLYLICWSYILAVSLPFLPSNAFEWLWIIKDIEDPFSFTRLIITTK